MFQPNCEETWMENNNPYTADQDLPLNRFCSGGMVNMTGTNITGIMETMKFAFHLTLVSDLLKLEKMISKANFTYTMKSSHYVIKNVHTAFMMYCKSTI